MTAEDRVKTVAEFGFTDRQARFLVLVMRHAGVCLLRQYSAFAGIVHGQKTRAFFEKLVNRRYASAYPCRHNRARLYHVDSVGLYRAIGEPNSAHRRPVSAGSIRERLMVLDAVLADTALDWLTTGVEKGAYFASLMPPVAIENLCRLTNASCLRAVDSLTDKRPIGIDANGRVVFLYIVLPSGRDCFRTFLDRLGKLLRALPSWTLRLVFPRQLANTYEAFQAVVREEWDSPLHTHTVEELLWYFEQRRTTRSTRPRSGIDERFDRAAWAFERPRFNRLYRRWLREGNSVFADVSSAQISEALATGAGRLECLIQHRRYDHLAPLVDTVGRSSREADEPDDGRDAAAAGSPLLDQSETHDRHQAPVL